MVDKTESLEKTHGLNTSNFIKPINAMKLSIPIDYTPDYIKDLYRRADDYWGDKQLIMLFEEIGELTEVITNIYFPIDNGGRIVDELVDVFIMLEQFAWKYNLDRVETIAQEMHANMYVRLINEILTISNLTQQASRLIRGRASVSDMNLALARFDSLFKGLVKHYGLRKKIIARYKFKIDRLEERIRGHELKKKTVSTEEASVSLDSNLGITYHIPAHVYARMAKHSREHDGVNVKIRMSTVLEWAWLERHDLRTTLEKAEREDPTQEYNERVFGLIVDMEYLWDKAALYRQFEVGE
ncbi:hypothetical protein LCGC14_0174280 [marine sediment metagenome]|uniref:Uncharacterized protein n=1 Tax=marine sediment metagenome TaxID=412755 RepID=A0A0F9UQY9_9ZZZZ